MRMSLFWHNATVRGVALIRSLTEDSGRAGCGHTGAAQLANDLDVKEIINLGPEAPQQ